MLDEIKENEVPKAQKNQEQQQALQAPASVKISTRLSRPPERFSPSLYYVLMTDSVNQNVMKKQCRWKLEISGSKA